jgi:hypothetical protein
MPQGWSNSGIDARVEKHFRITIDMSDFSSSTESAIAQRNGAVSPNGNFPNTNKGFYSTNLTGGKSTTRATTDALALRRERGLMRWEQVVRNLQLESNCSIYDVEIIEANGDAQATNLQFTVGYEDTDSIDLTKTSIDGSTVNNTLLEAIKEYVYTAINAGTDLSDDSTVQTGEIKELRSVFRPASSNTAIEEVTANAPNDSGQIFDAITVSQITTTKLVSGEDS